VATVPDKRAISDPDLRDRLYELLEHDHLPHSVGSRFVRLIVVIIVLDVLAAILASVPEYDAKLHRLFTTVEVAAVVAFALEYLAPIWSVVGHSLWRRGAGDTARQDRLGIYDRGRLRDDRAAGGDHLDRVCRGGAAA
jgi:hypothetical protein